MSAIHEVFAWECLDSRGRPTVGCEVTLRDGARGRAIVPSGASTGSHEATELRDGDERYGGRGVTRAVRNVHDVLRPTVVGMDAGDLAAVDHAMESTDPDPLLATVGANGVLGVSLATLSASADSICLPLWRFVCRDEPLLPMPMVNIMSGGAHADGALDIQDVLVVPIGARSFKEAIEMAWRVRQATAHLLAERGADTALVADEGGLAARMSSNAEALSTVVDGIARAQLEPGVDVTLAIDVAANQLWTGSGYRLAIEDRTLTAGDWLDTVAQWCERFPISSVEDVLTEDDWSGWALASELIGGGRRQLLGDDLFATNLKRLRNGIERNVANAVLVKPNQAGTVSRAAAVVTEAQSAGYATVVSARSGDTEDHWLADLAVGWRAGQVKVGSLMRSERTSKWNRLLEIEARLGETAQFAGARTLAGWELAEHGDATGHS